MGTPVLPPLSWPTHSSLPGPSSVALCCVRFDLELVTPAGGCWPVAFFLPLLPAVVGIKLLVFVTLRVHRGSWRYVSMPDLLGMLSAATWALGLTIILFYLVQYTWFLGSGGYLLNGLPETVFLLDWLFGVLLVGSARLFVRLTHEESGNKGNEGRGGDKVAHHWRHSDAAESVLRELARGRPNTPAYRVVGLLDDAPGRQRTRIHGAPVLGTIADLPAIARKHQVGELLIALPSATKAQMQRIITLCRSTQVSSTGETGTENTAGIRFRIIPSFSELIGGGDVAGGRAALAQIRDVSVNDILGRDAVDTDLAAVGGMLHGKVVLVSGAGGSIGAEICRTIARFAPSTLVLLDKAENAIFEIERELRKTFPTLRIVPGIGDITDPVRVDQVFAEFLPAVVFHAAAHKHVPLAEANPGEAIRNNVFGTRVLADAAARHGTQHFVMISTDKAVNPTSIMGATKRCAEIYIQYLSRRSATSFITVRFGNVLGSNGSVVPIFKQQIAAGGPVTVTHPEMRPLLHDHSGSLPARAPGRRWSATCGRDFRPRHGSTRPHPRSRP